MSSKTEDAVRRRTAAAEYRKKLLQHKELESRVRRGIVGLKIFLNFFYCSGWLLCDNCKYLQRPFYERWKMLEKEVIEPRNHERQHVYQSRNPYYRYDLEPFRVRRKDFWLLSTVNKLLKEFSPRLSHEADGLIFQVFKSKEKIDVSSLFAKMENCRL